MSAPRRARVRALAKLNLDLRVLAKRADGYHELRTVFQTISLADALELEYTPARRTEITLGGNVEIADNLVTRAARLLFDAMRRTGRLAVRLTKRIPMGAGLGGGSSDAAAVLLALPALAGRSLDLATLTRLGAELGSDVPFFLLGGAAVGIGRGEELFPLPDRPAQSGIVVAPGVHVSTAEAYRALSSRLTTDLHRTKIVSFQSYTWGLECAAEGHNDFEDVVFEQHPELAALKRRLRRSGAAQAMMTGSGSSLFALYPSPEAAAKARQALGVEQTIPIRLVSRSRYRSLWWSALRGHLEDRSWPPRSRYKS